MTGTRKQSSSSLWALLGQDRSAELKADGRGHDMYCSSCGTQAPDDAKFCASCGHQLERQTLLAPQKPVSSTVASTGQSSPEVKHPAKTQHRISRRIMLVFLWLTAISASVSSIIFITLESPERYQMGTGLFFGYGGLAAMYAKKLKLLWFFVGGVAAIVVLGILDGLIRRALHGLPIFT